MGTSVITSRRVFSAQLRRTHGDTTVGELGPDEFGKRVAIRSKEFLGTVYGTLLGVVPHANLQHFTTVHLTDKKPLTFRNDIEVQVVDDVAHVLQ